MIKLYVIIARYRNGAMIVPDFSEEFIFVDKNDALNAFRNLTNIPTGVVELELQEFIGNCDIETRTAPFPVVDHV